MKTIKLSIEQARELYNSNKEFRTTILHEFTDEELGIEVKLKEWEDLDFVGSYYPTHTGRVGVQNQKGIDNFLNVPTEKHAKSMIAFAKLSMLMADLGEECNLDWVNINEIKYVITRINDNLHKLDFYE